MILQEAAFDALPEARRLAVIDSYSDSADIIKSKINEFSENISVKKTKLYLNEELKLVMREPHYNVKKSVIFMDERIDNDEYAETWKHEVGHFIDHQMGWVSHSEQFESAKDADLGWFENEVGIETAAKMVKELRNSSAIDNRYVSDILSGLFHDKKRVRTVIEVTYDSLGIAIYGHEDAYWKELKGPQKAVEGEIFADLFAIYTESNTDTVNFMEKWFPNITSRFKKELAG